MKRTKQNFDGGKRVEKAYWKEYFECSNCGEISNLKRKECPFCHAIMRNHRDIAGGYQPTDCLGEPPDPPTSGSNIQK